MAPPADTTPPPPTAPAHPPPSHGAHTTAPWLTWHAPAGSLGRVAGRRSAGALRTSETPRAALPLHSSRTCARLGGKRRGGRNQARRFGDRRSPVVGRWWPQSSDRRGPNGQWHSRTQQSIVDRRWRKVGAVRGGRRNRSSTPHINQGEDREQDRKAVHVRVRASVH